MASTPEPAVEPRRGPGLTAVWLGRRDFAGTLQAQLRAREALVRGEGPPVLFLVEHPPTLTIGRRGRRTDILWGEQQLAAAGITVCETPRGGEVTLHAPGQLVAYPVVRVERRILEHMLRMADTSIQVLAELGVEGARFRREHPGVWLDDRKLASIGIHVSRGVTVQGLSLNLDVAPALFTSLVSCGLREANPVSVAAVLQRAIPLPPIEQVARRWAQVFADRSGTPLSWAVPSELAS